MLLLDVVYFVVILLCLPLLPLWLKFVLKKEYRDILKHRLSPNIQPAKNNRERIWIHAVSVGEVRSLKYLMEKLGQKYGDKEIVLSVTTPSGFEWAKKEYQDIAVINAPLDFSFTVKKFINNINPQLLILNELEIWPNWVTAVQRRKIPILLVNGRISELAFQRYKKAMFLLKGFFNKIDRFLVQADLYKDRFRQLNIPPGKIVVCGNIKADEAFNCREHLPPDREIMDFLGIKAGKNRKKIVTIASSHLRDEQLLIPIINRANKDFLFILVPRHINRAAEIEKSLANHGVDYFTWSKRKTTGPDDTGKTLLFDKMGYLFNILKVSDIVFMGGTMERKIGGHNLYEPAVLGKMIIGGPYYNNFPDIGEELVEKGLYKIIEDSGACLQMLQDFKKTDERLIAANAAGAVEAVSGRKGSTGCILKEIQHFIG